MTKEREDIVINDAVSISAGDFESVFRRLYTPLFYHAFDIVGDSELARDIVSEVFTRVWKEHRDLQQAGLKNYLYAAVRNHSVDEMRHQGRVSEVPIDLATDIDAVDESWKQREQQIDRLQRALTHLSEKSREIVDMRYRQHIPLADIAQRKNMSVAGVKKSLYRSIAALRDLMNAKNTPHIVHLLLL